MRLAVLALGSAVALSLGCASERVQTDYDRAAVFTRLRTFAWLDPPVLLRYELEMREVTRDSPISVSGGLGGGFGGGGHYGGVGSGVGYSPSSTRQEGTLILDVIDPATQQVAWRGWGTASVRDDQIAPERLQELVAAILERFPPEAKPRAD
jgi:hypothetical protein